MLTLSEADNLISKDKTRAIRFTGINKYDEAVGSIVIGPGSASAARTEKSLAHAGTGVNAPCVQESCARVGLKDMNAEAKRVPSREHADTTVRLIK
ncbi:MAG TPA: hypothetical protein VK463_19435 [Desulfomonilaceae bacterium]|nr:hypothetical protein [Desulfomonilaceae bacterium]